MTEYVPYTAPYSECK